MSTTRFCSECGKTLPSDGPQGLCAECLFRAALPGQSSVGSAATGFYDSSPAVAASSLEPGARLQYFGDYELLEEIARGGMGVVWKARQTSLKRDVALKMIRAGALAGPDEVQRFLREAEAAANLQHPNIVAIHEVGEHGGQHYFSMDLVEGDDLGTLVKDGPLAPWQAARYVKTIAEAIQYAHQRGTLHRDLKPQNVLIDAADQPRITDFGLAKIIDDDSLQTKSGVVMGSPSYMPPEQAAGRQADIGPASDVYSLGAMLYELLTGQPPFRGVTAMSTLRDVMESEPPAPRGLKADIPPDLETICLKCLEKSPTARYPTARALAEELDRYLKGEPIQARPASVVRKVVSWTRRNPGILAAVAALVMVALAFGLFYLYEENAFLRAQQADPTLARVRGPNHEATEIWKALGSAAFVAGAFLFLFVTMRSHGLTLRTATLTAMREQPLKPLDRRTKNIAIGGGVILVSVGVMLLVKMIQAHVWEGERISWAVIYLPIYFGFATFGVVFRDYRRTHYGTASRQLTAEQIEPIRRAMEYWDLVTAIQAYRLAVPDATSSEATEYVIRLALSQRAEHPGKFVPPPFSLATANWRLMGICAAVQAVILGAWWYLHPQPYPILSLAQFGYCLLFGLAMIAAFRVSGVGRKILLFIPAIVLLLFSEIVLPRLVGASSHSPQLYFFGYFFGIFMMMFGLVPRRRL